VSENSQLYSETLNETERLYYP